MSQGGPHGQSLSWFWWHEANEYCNSPPGWDSSPSQGYPHQYVAGTHLFTWVERENVG